MKKVYLAAPFFNELELKNMWYVADLLQKSNYDVYIPQKLKIENAWNMSNKEWAKAVFEEDIKALDMADNVVLMNYGINMDSGTAWEGINSSIIFFFNTKSFTSIMHCCFH